MEDQIYNYGDYKLDKQSLINSINASLESYIKYKNYSDQETEEFVKTVKYITDGITKGSISKDVTFVPTKPG
jgi:iron uptake system EfeUOB component EfeO/EfeM